ncbi:hypothetical protein ACVDG5_006960 [Mesorhizobium sp. ORM6]
MNALVRLIAVVVVALLVNGFAMAAPLVLGIARAVVVSDPVSGKTALSLEMTPDSAKAFADFRRTSERSSISA